MDKIYIIEARDKDGRLKFDCPQPESFFGTRAITGLSDWEMSRPIYAKLPDATLRGDNIPDWPKLINENWVARVKTW